MADDLERLTPRHRAVLGLVADGLSNKEIAITLDLSQHTVKGYVEDILLILGVPNRAAAGARWATEQAHHESDGEEGPPPPASAE